MIIDALAGPIPADAAWSSTHASGVAEGIELARVVGKLPARLVLYGIEASSFELGAPMAPAVAGAVARVAEELAGRLGVPGAAGPR